MHKDDRKFIALLIVIALVVVALIMGLGYATDWSGDDVQCIQIGSNACVPVTSN